MTLIHRTILRIGRNRRASSLSITAALIRASVNGAQAGLDYICACPVPGPAQLSLL